MNLMPTPIPYSEALRVGLAILEAHGQWEKENNRAGGQFPWQDQHVCLLGRAAIVAALTKDDAA